MDVCGKFNQRNMQITQPQQLDKTTSFFLL